MTTPTTPTLAERREALLAIACALPPNLASPPPGDMIAYDYDSDGYIPLLQITRFAGPGRKKHRAVSEAALEAFIKLGNLAPALIRDQGEVLERLKAEAVVKDAKIATLEARVAELEAALEDIAKPYDQADFPETIGDHAEQGRYLMPERIEWMEAAQAIIDAAPRRANTLALAAHELWEAIGPEIQFEGSKHFIVSPEAVEDFQKAMESAAPAPADAPGKGEKSTLGYLDTKPFADRVRQIAREEIAAHAAKVSTHPAFNRLYEDDHGEAVAPEGGGDKEPDDAEALGAGELVECETYNFAKWATDFFATEAHKNMGRMVFPGFQLDAMKHEVEQKARAYRAAQGKKDAERIKAREEAVIERKDESK